MPQARKWSEARLRLLAPTSSILDLAVEFNCSETAISHACKRFGIKTRGGSNVARTKLSLADLKACATKGLSPQDIATHFACALGTVYNKANTHGITFSPHGYGQVWTDEAEDRLIALVRAGTPRKDILTLMSLTSGALAGKLYRLRAAGAAVPPTAQKRREALTPRQFA